ncbi:uncharacterized protein LOC115737179 [Rhodamnia argentea]|uniref:Uncharacterized protein LOC115737179 n=1 Tax=Rhodamnia argentea TaxID=178133 RepID=A0A8B8NT34_9MYRT|nr:uncharacterized protein LOC115737179 [Rhodamnia argentea]
MAMATGAAMETFKGEGCEEVNYAMCDSRSAEGIEEYGFAIIDLDELHGRNARCVEGSSMRSDIEVGDISLYANASSDNVDFLNMDSQFEYTHPEFNADVDMEKLGMCFSNAKEFREAIKNYAIKNGRQVRFAKNAPNKVRAVCSEGCGWLIYASKMQGEQTLQVKTYNPIHKCNRALHVPQVSSKWLAKKYCDRLRNNPTWPGASMKKTMESENVLKLSRTMVYRARATAMSMVTGNEREQFRMLRSYCQALLDSNPRSTFVIKSEQCQDQSKFRGVYICLDALRRGFLEGCRRFVGFDGCHLSSGYKGVLLAFVGLDGNNQMYPFAWAVVGQETYETRTWFISMMAEDPGIGDPTNSKYWTFLCDKQKGLVQALANLMPEVEHIFCLRHLYENFRLRHKGMELKRLVWKATMATRVCDFNLAMEELKAVNEKAHDWLSQRPPVQWSKSHFGTSSKCDASLNNRCESFNKSIIDAGDKPIITLVEAIRVQLMERIHKQKDGLANYNGVICPKIREIPKIPAPLEIIYSHPMCLSKFSSIYSSLLKISDSALLLNARMEIKCISAF